MPKRSRLRCYFGCKKDGPLHLFPNPNSDSINALERFYSWKSILPKQVQEKGNSYIHNSVRICNRHFKECFCLPSNRLTANAIPTLFLDKQDEPSKKLAGPTDPLDQPSDNLVQEDHGHSPIVQKEFGSQDLIVQECESQGHIVQDEFGSQGLIVQECRSQSRIVQEKVGSQGHIVQEDCGSQGLLVQEEFGSQGPIVQECESQGLIVQDECGSQGRIVLEDFGFQGYIVQEDCGSQDYYEQEVGSGSEDNIVLHPTNSDVYHVVIDTSESDFVSGNNNRNTQKGSPKCYRPQHSKNKTVNKLKRKLENTSEKYGEMFTLYSKEQEMRYKELQLCMEAICKKNDELLKRISTLEQERKADQALIKELEEKVEKLERRDVFPKYKILLPNKMSSKRRCVQSKAKVDDQNQKLNT